MSEHILLQGVFNVHMGNDQWYRRENSAPKAYQNVRVFAVFPGSVPANAEIRNLKYANL